MKLLFCIVSLLSVISGVKAQSEFTITYAYDFSRHPCELLLVYKNGIVKYISDRPESQFEKDNILYEQEQSYQELYYKIGMDSLYMNRIQDKYKTYLISSFVDDWNWQIMNEYKSILGFKCQKAIGTNDPEKSKNTMTIEAYFTTEIPIPVGPYRYKGTPGAILEVYIPFENGDGYYLNAVSVDFEPVDDIIIKLEGKEVSKQEILYPSIINKKKLKKLPVITKVYN